MGEWGKKWGNGGNITANRSGDVFQNIFAHDLIVVIIILFNRENGCVLSTTRISQLSPL